MSERNIIKSTAEYTRSYENMRGVSFGNTGDAAERFGYLENMYIDYEGGADAVESVPGFRRLWRFDGKINGIFMQRLGRGEEYLIVHAGGGIFRFKKDGRDTLADAPPEFIIEAEDTESRAFSAGTSTFIIDGAGMIKIDSDGTAERISRESSRLYIPTTYIDGNENEARNLLSDSFIERFTVSSLSALLHGSFGLSYKILDDNKRTCAVSGASVTLEGALYIPSEVKIGGISYTVTEVSEWALRNQTKITELYTSPGIRVINSCAFWGCTALEKAVISSTVESLGEYAFFGATALNTLYLGISLTKIDTSAFDECPALLAVHYAGLEYSFKLIEGYESLYGKKPTFASTYGAIMLEIPVHTVNGTVSEVTVNGITREYEHDLTRGVILIPLPGRSYADGKEVVIRGSFGTLDRQGFLGTELASQKDASNAIYGCRLAEVFDGRIFLSGNPDLAGAVFHSAVDSAGCANPFYFPADGCFIDGVGDYPVTAMLSAEDSLFVFKSEDDGAGSVFRHMKKEDKYPVAFIAKDLKCYPAATSFLGDSLFLSSMGVTAIEAGSSGSFELVNRSERIRAELSHEDTKRILACRFGSYIAVVAGTRIYLGDSHDTYRGESGKQYEWYPLSGVCTYENESPVYRYAQEAPQSLAVSTHAGERVSGEVMSVGDGKGGLIYFTEEGGFRIAVYPTDELCGGTPSPISAVLGGELFFFGTLDGSLCLFNTDKRGVPPPDIASFSDFNLTEYQEKMGKKIHPYYYSFGNRAYRSALKTKSDTCALPYLRKSTVRSSLTLRCKSFGRSVITCEVGTDREAFKSVLSAPVGVFGFELLDFSALSLSLDDAVTLTASDPTKGWIEKSVAVYSDEFRSPIGIYSINYRYKIKGRAI